jgi:hypothetical protein
MVTQLSSNPNAVRAFRAIEEGRGKMSGWGVAKTVGIQAEEAEVLLKDLRDQGVVDSTDPGLDGFYSLTKLGFELRDRLPIAV